MFRCWLDMWFTFFFVWLSANIWWKKITNIQQNTTLLFENFCLRMPQSDCSIFLIDHSAQRSFKRLYQDAKAIFSVHYNEKIQQHTVILEVFRHVGTVWTPILPASCRSLLGFWVFTIIRHESVGHSDPFRVAAKHEILVSRNVCPLDKQILIMTPFRNWFCCD